MKVSQYWCDAEGGGHFEGYCTEYGCSGPHTCDEDMEISESRLGRVTYSASLEGIPFTGSLSVSDSIVV